MTATQTACIICDTPTDSTQTGHIGGTSGPVCDDCAYWSDGNLTEA